MVLHVNTDEAMSKAFPLTLTGLAQTWYGKLKPRSISSFDELGSKFVAHFQAGQVKSKVTDSLFALKQRSNESLLAFTNRFHTETLNVDNFEDSIALSAFREGLLPAAHGTFSYKMTKKPYDSYAKAHRATLSYGSADDVTSSRMGVQLGKRPQVSAPALVRRDDEHLSEEKRRRPQPARQLNPAHHRPPPKFQSRFQQYTLLTMAID